MTYDHILHKEALYAVEKVANFDPAKFPNYAGPYLRTMWIDFNRNRKRWLKRHNVKVQNTKITYNGKFIGFIREKKIIPVI